MLNKKNQLFYFINKLSEKDLNNILKYKNLNVVYVYNKIDPLDKIIYLRNFCKKNKIKFYLSNNLKIGRLLSVPNLKTLFKKTCVLGMVYAFTFSW